MYARVVNAGQAMIFFPAAIHLPVRCIFCIVSHGFSFPARVPGRSFGQVPERTLSADTFQRRVFARYCPALCQAVWYLYYVFFTYKGVTEPAEVFLKYWSNRLPEKNGVQ